jgi:putative tryptophan/tyrosine transport system substrate-binding protein
MKRREFITLLGGAAATWPIAARAQQPVASVVTLGLLSPVGMTGASPALMEALGKLGYQQGRNLTILLRAAKDSNAELPGLAAELVNLKPDVLVALTTPPSLALKNATATIPIVMVAIGDPIATGLVQSLAHPGGNVTGTANAVEEWGAKGLQIVTEMLPGIRCMIYLRNPANPAIMAQEEMRRNVAEKLGVGFAVIDASTPEQLDRVLAAPLDDNCRTALFLSLDGLFIARRAQIAEFALRQKIALFAPFPKDAEAGALIAFGINLDEQWRVGASYVDQIVKGAKPADLPVQRPVKFETVINLKTAKAIGVEVPTSLLLSADRVIE